MTINFRTDRLVRSGLQAIRHIENIWDMSLTLPTTYHEWLDKRKKFDRIEQDATADPLTNVLLRSPADKWEVLIREHAEQENIHQYILDNSPTIRGGISNKINAIIAGPETYNHIMQQLPVGEVEQTFKESAAILGDAVSDPTAALDIDPQAAADFRHAGRKLTALIDLAPAVQARTFLATTEVGELPELAYTKLRMDSPVMHFTDEEQNMHHQVEGARRRARQEPGEYLAELARGQHPLCTLKFARTWDEFQNRADQAQTINEKTRRETKSSGFHASRASMLSEPGLRINPMTGPVTRVQM